MISRRISTVAFLLLLVVVFFTAGCSWWKGSSHKAGIVSHNGSADSPAWRVGFKNGETPVKVSCPFVLLDVTDSKKAKKELFRGDLVHGIGAIPFNREWVDRQCEIHLTSDDKTASCWDKVKLPENTTRTIWCKFSANLSKFIPRPRDKTSDIQRASYDQDSIEMMP